MKKKMISLKGLSEILSEKELKNVLGGSSSNGGCGDDCGSSENCTLRDVNGEEYSGKCTLFLGTCHCTNLV